LQIVYYPDPILLKRADTIVTIDDEIRRKAKEMIQLMALEKGIGLAAPQVFVTKMRPADRAQNKKKLEELRRRHEESPAGPAS
jgi:peptide deformylase